jgi:hypothetical protein
MTDLQSALDNAGPAIERALAAARDELASLRSREAELLQLIRRAELVLAESPVSELAVPERGMTLHQALVQVLREHDNAWMTVQELAQAVTERGLYRKRDGSPVEVNQVHARTNNYKAVFEKDGPNIRLREEPLVLTMLPDQIELFRNDDGGFFEWLEEHSDGFFLNCNRTPVPNYLVLHRPDCRHFKGDRAHLSWTKDYIKLCSTDREPLESWASEAFGEEAEITLCSACFDG